MKPRILLVGGGGHCGACIDVIEREQRFTIVGIIDGRVDRQEISGYPILGGDDLLRQLRRKFDFACVTVGQIADPEPRIRLVQLLTELGYHLPSIISPRAMVSRTAHVGNGTIVMHDALVNAHAHVDENCILNTKSLVEHDARIAAFCHISTGAIVNGGAHVGYGSFVGSGAVVREQVHTPDRIFVKALSLYRGEIHV